MGKPIQNVSIIQMNRRGIGRLVSPTRKMRKDLELFVVKKSPFGTGILREFLVSKVKAPLITLLNLVSDKLPEPTKDNTWNPNTHNLLDLRDEFFQHENNPSRHKAFKAIWNFVIILYDSDLYYRERIDWVMGCFRKIDWQPYEGEEKPREPWWKE